MKRSRDSFDEHRPHTQQETRYHHRHDTRPRLDPRNGDRSPPPRPRDLPYSRRPPSPVYRSSFSSRRSPSPLVRERRSSNLSSRSDSIASARSYANPADHRYDREGLGASRSHRNSRDYLDDRPREKPWTKEAFYNSASHRSADSGSLYGRASSSSRPRSPPTRPLFDARRSDGARSRTPLQRQTSPDGKGPIPIAERGRPHSVRSEVGRHDNGRPAKPAHGHPNDVRSDGRRRLKRFSSSPSLSSSGSSYNSDSDSRYSLYSSSESNGRPRRKRPPPGPLREKGVPGPRDGPKPDVSREPPPPKFRRSATSTVSETLHRVREPPLKERSISTVTFSENGEASGGRAMPKSEEAENRTWNQNAALHHDGVALAKAVSVVQHLLPTVDGPWTSAPLKLMIQQRMDLLREEVAYRESLSQSNFAAQVNLRMGWLKKLNSNCLELIVNADDEADNLLEEAYHTLFHSSGSAPQRSNPETNGTLKDLPRSSLKQLINSSLSSSLLSSSALEQQQHGLSLLPLGVQSVEDRLADLQAQVADLEKAFITSTDAEANIDPAVSTVQAELDNLIHSVQTSLPAVVHPDQVIQDYLMSLAMAEVKLRSATMYCEMLPSHLQDLLYGSTPTWQTGASCAGVSKLAEGLSRTEKQLQVWDPLRSDSTLSSVDTALSSAWASVTESLKSLLSGETSPGSEQLVALPKTRAVFAELLKASESESGAGEAKWAKDLFLVTQSDLEALQKKLFEIYAAAPDTVDDE